jgi:anti-sigma factor RsiW
MLLPDEVAQAHPALRGATVTCQEVVAVLADYLEATLSPDLLARLEAHLQDCAACRAYLATYRPDEVAGRRGQSRRDAEEMKARLRDFLLRELQEGR